MSRPRLPPFKPLDLGDQRLNRMQEYLGSYLDQLDQDVQGLRSPLSAMTGRNFQIVDERLVDYQGPGGHTIRLPPAAVAGAGRAAFVDVVNNGQGSITIAAIGKDTVDGARVLELGTGSVFVGLASGAKEWSSVNTASLGMRYYSVVDMAAAFGASRIISVADGNFTEGQKFSPLKDCHVTGVRFFWKDGGGGAQTMRCKIWVGFDATVLGSKDVTVNASGIYTAQFDAPIPLVRYDGYYCTVHNPTTGTRHCRIDISDSGPQSKDPITRMVYINPFAIGRNFCAFASGDNIPNTTSTAVEFLVEPILTD